MNKGRPALLALADMRDRRNHAPPGAIGLRSPFLFASFYSYFLLCVQPLRTPLSPAESSGPYVECLLRSCTHGHWHLLHTFENFSDAFASTFRLLALFGFQ